MKKYGAYVREIVEFVDEHPRAELPMTGVMFTLYGVDRMQKQLNKLYENAHMPQHFLLKTAAGALAATLVMGQSDISVFAAEPTQIFGLEQNQADDALQYEPKTVPYGTTKDKLELPKTLRVIDGDGNHIEVQVVWVCEDYDEQPDKTTTYRFTATLPEDYVAVNNLTMPQIEVTVQSQPLQPLAVNGAASNSLATATVSDFSSLQTALNDPAVTTIMVDTSFSLTDTLHINHDVSIIGTNTNIVLKRETTALLFEAVQGNISFENIQVDGNKANYDDSFPILVNNGATVDLKQGVIFENNKGVGNEVYADKYATLNRGIAILNREGTLTLDGAVIRNNETLQPQTQNTESNAAGIGNLATLIINDGEISNNTSVSRGGGITNCGNIIMNGGSIINNTVHPDEGEAVGGAGIANSGYRSGEVTVSGTLTINGGYFSGNKVITSGSDIGRGGAIYNVSHCTLNLFGGVIDSSNTATQGGAIFHSAREKDADSVLNIKNDPIVNADIYVYNYNIDNGAQVQLTLENAIAHPITIQPSSYDPQYPIVKGTSTYQITDADLRKIKIKSDGATQYYPNLDQVDNKITLSQTRPSYIKDEIYVNGKTGHDDSGDGSSDNPYQTINKGLENTAPGGTIYIDDTVVINDTVIVEAPTDVYGPDSVTIKPTTSCKTGTTCQSGTIVVGPSGELILGPIHVEAPIQVEQGGKLTTSQETDIKQSIIKQPENISILEGNTGNLEVSVNPVPGYTYTYQWYQNSDASTTGGTLISGANNAVYSPQTSAVGNKYYYCIITATKTADTSTIKLTSDAAKVSVVQNELKLVSAVDETYKGDHDGQLIHVNDAMEYKLLSASDYIAVPSGQTSISNLAPGVYEVRYKNTSTSRQITIQEGPVYVFNKPDLSVQSKTFTYGDLGQIQLTIKNNSQETINVTDITMPYNSAFAKNLNRPTIAPGQSTTIPFEFADPYKKIGDYYSTVTIAYDGTRTKNKTEQATLSAKVQPKTIQAHSKKGVTFSKPYDGTTSAPVSEDDFTLQGVVNNDNVSIRINQAVYASPEISPATDITVKFFLIGNDVENYMIDPTSLVVSGSITASPLNVTLKKDANIQKEYDGNANLTLDSQYFDVTGIHRGDDVSVSGIGVYTDKNVGSNKSVTITLQFSGTDSSKYTPSTVTLQAEGSITPKHIRMSANTPLTKVYDGTDKAILVAENFTFQDKVPGDELGLTSYQAIYQSKDAATVNPVTVTSIVLGGRDCANYLLDTQTLTYPTASITPKTIYAQAKSNMPIEKEYDGNTNAVITPDHILLSGVLGQDDASVQVDNALYDSAKLGEHKTVSAAIHLNGAQSDNYRLSEQTIQFGGLITPKTLTVTLQNPVDITKTYDGNKDIPLQTANFKISGIVNNEAVSVNGIGHFLDKNVGDAKPLSIDSLQLDGLQKENYRLKTQTLSGNGSITPKTISVTSVGTINKVYDGTTDASISSAHYQIHDIIAHDDLSLTISAAFDFADVNKAAQVHTSKITLSGTDKANYTLGTDMLSYTASISPKTVSVTWENPENYVYNKQDQSSSIVASFTDVHQNKQKLPITFNGSIFQNAGEYDATVNSNDSNYTFTNTVKHFVIQPKPIDDSMLSGIEDHYEYTGSAITPVPQMSDTGTQLGTSDFDYTYENNRNKGMAEIIITGKGNYKGSITKTFTIGYKTYTGTILPDTKNAAGFYQKAFEAVIPNGYEISLDDQVYADHLTISQEGVHKTLNYYLRNKTTDMVYVGKEDYSLDTTTPNITGVTDGETYYVDQIIHVDDANLKQVYLNGTAYQNQSSLTLKGNQNKTFTIKAVDQADHETSVTITMKPIASLDTLNKDIDHVQDGDQTALKKSIEEVKKVDTTTASDEQKQALQDMSDALQGKLDRIDAVNEQLASLQSAQDAIDFSKLTSDDKATLENLKQDMAILQQGDNLSVDQRKDIDNRTDVVEQAIKEVNDIIDIYQKGQDSITNTDLETVKRDDQEKLTEGKQNLQSLIDNNHLTNQETQEAQNVIQKADGLLNQIQIVQQKLDSLKEIDTIDQNNVEKTDRDPIDRVQATMDDLLNHHAGNLNEAEKTTVSQTKEHADQLNDVLDQVEALESSIQDLKDSGSLTNEEIQQAESTLKTFDKLSQHQKELLDHTLADKLDQVMQVIGVRKLIDQQTGITIEGVDNLFLPSTVLKIEKVTFTQDQKDFINKQLRANEEMIAVYNIQLMLDGAAIQPNGTIKITIPLTQAQAATPNLRLIYLDENGKITDIPYQLNGDSIVFTAAHLSRYGLVKEVQPISNTSEINTGDTTHYGQYAMMLLASTGVLAMLYKKQTESIPDPASSTLAIKGVRRKMKFSWFLLKQAIAECGNYINRH